MFILKTASKYILSIFKNKGFTLLEIMISVSIIALIFTSLFRMQSGTIGLAKAGKFNSIAPALARQLLVRMEQDLANWSESEGDFGENFPGIKWSCQISDALFDDIDFISEENYKRFKKIDIEIKMPSSQRSYTVTTWRFLID